MSGPFKLRSGNVTPFKQMGSSPAKQEKHFLERESTIPEVGAPVPPPSSGKEGTVEPEKVGTVEPEKKGFTEGIKKGVKKGLERGSEKVNKPTIDIKGYLKGEQGLIPDIKGESTVETGTKVSKAIQSKYGELKKKRAQKKQSKEERGE